MVTVIECEKKLGNVLKTIKSDLHMHPELSMQEHRTTQIIKDQLTSLGIEILEFGLRTGVVGVLHGSKKGSVVALRADMDALPISETSGDKDMSLENGKMHACGHDVHTTSLLGAAMLLKELRENMFGSVLFVFQPAEETVEGAKLIINAGLFERMNIDAVFGLHVHPEIEVGHVGIKTGAVMAAKDSFLITIIGSGGHGSAPQNTTDPIVAGAALIAAIQSIVSRNIDSREAAVISVCSVHAGNADNIIPNILTLQGSMRSFSQIVREVMKRKLEEMACSVAKAYGCKARVKIEKGAPILMNDPLLGPIAQKSAEQVLGKNRIVDQELDMSSEDFAEFANRVPSFFYFLGSGTPGIYNCELHNSGFHANERTPIIGAALLASTAWNAQQTFINK